jgi:transposase
METNDLFTAALRLDPPWTVAAIDFEQGTEDERGRLDIHIGFARGGELPCPECGAACKAYDAEDREWRHLDFFQHVAYLHARVPRVRCLDHGVRRANVPWARPGSGFTLLFEALMLTMAAQMPVAAIARMVREHDTRLWRIVNHHVEEARERVDMSSVTELVVDETSRAKGHSYVTIFLEPESAEDGAPRALYVADGRDHRVFHDFKADLMAHGGAPGRVGDICMDMSSAFMLGAFETMPLARVTLDRFHVMKLVNEAVDDARRRESKEHDELKGTRYDWLMNPSRLSPKRRARVASLSGKHLKTAKAYQMRLNLRDLWAQPTITAARRYLKKWCSWVLKATAPPRDSKRTWILERMRTAASSIKLHAEQILNYYRRLLTSGVIEGANSLVQAARARARGYRNAETFKTIIYLIAGRLSFELPQTHWK